MSPYPTRLLAVDPSLTCSGWVLFSVRSAQPIGYGVLSPVPKTGHLAERLANLQSQIADLYEELRLRESDLVVCEGPAPLVLNPQSAIKVEHVRGMFEVLARARGVVVPGRINPRTIQSEVLGMRGKQMQRKQVKAWARDVAERLYGETLRGSATPAVMLGERALSGRSPSKSKTVALSQDIIDAMLVGTLALSRIQVAERSGMSLISIFASQFGSASRTSARARGRRNGRWDVRRIQRGSNGSSGAATNKG